MRWLGQAAEHETDHGEADEGGNGASVALEIARQAAIAADPGQAPLDDPALGQSDELVQFAAFDDFHDPAAGGGCGALDTRALIAGVGEDAMDERKQPTRAPIENQPCAVAVLHVGGVDHDIQQEAERIDENMALAARDLLGRIKALRVERRAPF